MTNKSNLHITKTQAGYTIVEMLVANALLIAVLIPTLLYLGRVVNHPKARDTIIAMQLAQAQIEKTNAWSLYKTSEDVQEINHKTFFIRQDVQTQNELMILRVSVFREKDKLPLATLKKCQMLR